MTQKRRLFVWALALAGLATGAASGLAAAGSPPPRDFTEARAAAQTQREYLIVTFKDPPAASYTGGIPGLERTKPERGRKLDPRSRAVQAYVRYLANVHANYRAFLKQRAPRAEVVREYSYVLNGFAVKLNGERPEVVSAGPGVTRAGFSGLYRPDMTVSTGLIEAPALWSSLGGRKNAGSGIKIGIIDSGIDDTHPAFGCKGKIEHKLFFSGIPFGEDIVLDHGTHVAGTAAGCLIANDGDDLPPLPVGGDWSGVAPGASLTDYNVFPGRGVGFFILGGSAFSHDIAAAVEQAVVDGMDVINMSLGGGAQGPHDFLAEAVNAAVDAGVVAAVAAGNSGPGPATVESPGTAAKAITVGASSNPHFVGISVDATPTGGSALPTFGAAIGDFKVFGDTDSGSPGGDPEGEAAVTAPYTTTTPADGCTTISSSLTDKIALIVRGGCTFTTKIRNAESAGAVGVLVVNNVAGDPSAMAHDGTSPFPTIPAAMVSKNDGAAMGESGSVTVDGTSLREFLTANADIIAGFSSRGPAPFTNIIKPDVTAPGVNVYSSVFDDEFAFFQGTSMATPHVAGAAALLLDSHPGWSPADVKSALVTTGSRTVTDHEEGTVDPGVLARGGGRIDLASGANDVPLTLDPASASFGLFRGNADANGSLALTVRNVSGGQRSCTVGDSESPTGNRLVESPTTLSLAAGATTTLTVSFSGGKTAPSGSYTGDVTIDCDTGPDLRVPWLALVDRQAKP
jgi:minor extracellular serine protease Vpr